jgi:hypothetical protein
MSGAGSQASGHKGLNGTTCQKADRGGVQFWPKLPQRATLAIRRQVAVVHAPARLALSTLSAALIFGLGSGVISAH